MKEHDVKVAPVSAKEMKKHLEQRVADIRLPDSDPAYNDKVEYETARAQEGWKATCSCGWAANNPLSSKRDADEQAAAHSGLAELPDGEANIEGLGG